MACCLRTLRARIAVLTSVAATAAAIVGAPTAVAGTTLVAPPTSVPNSNVLGGFNDMARSRYVAPFQPDFALPCDSAAESCIGINYPATFWPVSGGLDGDKWNVSVGHGVENLNDVLLLELATSADPVVLFGYSQGARIVSISLQNLVNTLPPSFQDRLSVSLAGNISRPNGGVWARFTNLPTIPLLDITFGDPTPTDVFESCVDTPAACRVTDVSFQYDGVSDFPLYLFNVAAVANAVAGLVFPHTTYLGPAYGGWPDDYSPEEMASQMNPAEHPENFAYYGDTRYITIPSRELPLLRLIGDITPPALKPAVNQLIKLVEPVFRWAVDNGYDRSINPGQPTPIRLFPIPFVDYDPIQELSEFVDAVQQGIRNVADGVPGAADRGATPTAAAVSALRPPRAAIEKPVGPSGSSGRPSLTPSSVRGETSAEPSSHTARGVAGPAAHGTTGPRAGSRLRGTRPAGPFVPRPVAAA